MHATKKFALIGTSCVGKTTIIHSVEKELYNEMPGIKVAVIDEAARLYFTHNKTDLPFSFFHQSRIQNLARIQEEIAYFKNPDIILCDRSVLDAAAYVRSVGNIKFSKKLLEKEKHWLDTYDQFFLLNPNDIPYKTDSVRKEPREIRELFHKMFLKTLGETSLPYSLISGTKQQRTKHIVNHILKSL